MRASYLMFPHLKLELWHEFQLQQTLQDSMLTHIMELHDRCFHMNYSMISSGICYGISWPLFPRLTIQWLAHRQMLRDFVTAVSSPHNPMISSPANVTGFRDRCFLTSRSNCCMISPGFRILSHRRMLDFDEKTSRTKSHNIWSHVTHLEHVTTIPYNSTCRYNKMLRIFLTDPRTKKKWFSKMNLKYL